MDRDHDTTLKTQPHYALWTIPYNVADFTIYIKHYALYNFAVQHTTTLYTIHYAPSNQHWKAQ